MKTLPTVYLVRHGETEWSLARRHTSFTDMPLTILGEQQALRVEERLRGGEFDRVFSSPRIRARRTCELAGLASKMELNPDVAEWNYGEYEGVTTTDIRKQRPDWNLFRHGCPRGESPEDVAGRADRVVATLRQADGRVAIFSHGHFLRVLAARWVGWPVVEGRCLLMNTASVSVLGWEHDSSNEPIIAQWNIAVADASENLPLL